jgi:hypothetical protein
MTEESKRKDQAAQGDEEKSSSWSKVEKVFSDNQTIAVTVLYAYLTVVGMIYSASLYSRFGINVFDYSEIPDFLLVAFRNPISFFSAGISAVVGIALVDLLARRERWLMQRTHLEAERDTQKQEQVLRQRILVQSIIITSAFIFAFFVLPYVFAGIKARYIKSEETKVSRPAQIDVRYRSFSGSAGQVTEPDLRFIGATQRAGFLYDNDHNRTIVIPQSQIVSIEVPDE